MSLLDVDDPEWQAMLDDVPHDFYHLPGYVAVAAAEQGGRPCALSVRGGGVSLLVPLILRDLGPGISDATSPYGYPGPLLGGTGPRTLGDALTRGFKHLAEQGVVAVFLRLHPLLNAEPGPLPGHVVSHGDTVSIELPAGGEELWGRLRENHQRDITRTARLGYAARMDDEWEHEATFRRLYRETMERRGATPSYFFSDAYFTGLREALGDRLRLCVVEGDGRVVAAGLFVETASIVEYHLSGAEQGPHRLQPVKMMIHFVSGWASERGDRTLHLGGGVGGANDSLFLFKAGFSPLRHPFRTLRAVLRPQAYRRLVRASGRGPVDVPTESEFFPAYRSAKADTGG